VDVLGLRVVAHGCTLLPFLVPVQILTQPLAVFEVQIVNV
jgi:hypothetical protein